MGLGCANLESLNYSNFNDDICYVSALTRNPSTGVVSIRRVPMVAPNAGTFPVGQMFTGAREKQDGFNTLGKVNSSSQGNEIVNEQTTSITLRADTVYNALNPEVLPSTVNRNTMMAMLEGSGIDADGTYEEVISISGARLTCPVDITQAKWLFYKDGYFVVDGKKKNATTGEPEVRKNPYIDKYNKTDICTMMELAIYPTAETTDDVVFRFPFVTSQNVQFAEGNDMNNYTADCMFLADRKHVSKTLADGFSDNEVDTVATTGTESIYKINADYIIAVSGGTAPTVAGTAGQLAIVIDTADDTVEIYKYSTTWSADPVTSVLGQGFVAWTDEACSDLLATTPITASGDAYLMAVKTLGATGVAVAATNGTNNLFPFIDLITDDAARTTLCENHQAV